MRLGVSFAFLAACLAAQDAVTVEGMVVNKVTGAGIGGATVRIMAPKGGRYDTTTDETGAFRISGIKPGDYNAVADKHGYFNPSLVPMDRPQVHFDASPETIKLRLELNPPAVIRGRVVGADGNPARASVDLGRGRMVNTNAEGAFIFENLEPGRYTLLARPKIVAPAGKPGEDRAEVVPTYYPSVVEPGQAESIVIRPGAELSGYEIRLQSVPVYRVRGVVLDPGGKPAPRAVVELQRHVPGGDSGFFIGGPLFRESFSIRTGELGLPETEEPFVTGDDGAFEFPSVPAGDWILRAEGEPVGDLNERQQVSSVASTIFSLGHGDPDEFKIQLANPFRLSGSVVLSDGSPAPPSVLLSLSLSSEIGPAGHGGTTGSGGVLRLDVNPGANQIQADVLAGNYYVDSILVGSADINSQRLEVTPASPPIKVILKPAGTIRGIVEDGAKGSVVIFPQSFTGIGYVAQIRPDKTFELAGIPPGDYYAIALDHFDPRTMADAVRLRSWMPWATSVKIQQDSMASLPLRSNHIPD